MSNTNRRNNKEIQRGTANGRTWQSRGRGQASRLSNTPLKSIPQTATAEVTTTVSPSDAQTARRRMNLMASVSRSSGLQKDGDDLKNYEIQEEYRNFVQEKLDDVLTHHPWRVSESEKEKRQRIDSQENVLILFRKLREGITSSGRNDLFALEVYELSLSLAVIFESQKQAASIIPTLFARPDTAHSITTLHNPSIHSVLISLLHHLVTSYPSQSTYDQHRTQVLLREQSRASSWLMSLTRSLRMRNYAKFEILSKKKTVLEVIKESTTTTLDESQSHANSDLGLRALLFLVDSLRRKAGDSAWDTIRSAYRELSCDPTTKTWLRRSLCLDSVVLDNSSSEVENWLEQKVPLGHVRRKEGVEGRWIICKVR
ncbi:hypothetical protein BYT27DRAFT_7202779 [Phlegmacium glaucopus]|nr:hypothetical protein BYT27DRAFT_7202779 [Phlegmacium glaucopus]